MKKKVFFIMSTDDYSGAEVVNFDIIENLKHKYDFYWVSKKGNINKKLKEKNIKWIEISKLSRKEIKRVIKQYRPDILHATDYTASVITALTLTRIPIICHLHNNSPWIKKLCIYSFAFLFAAMRSKKVLTVSESIEKEYVFSKLIHKKIKNISNPIDYEKIQERIRKVRRVEKEYDICCVARVTLQKNPHRFIGIISRLKEDDPEIRAVWAGNGEMLEECRKRVVEEGLEENIEFIGYADDPFYYYVNSNIFMLTSSWEGYGLVAFEALASGLPCIVSKVGGLKNIVNDKCGALCETDYDFLEAYKAINDDICGYSNNAIRRAKELDNSKTYYDQIEAVYEK